MVRAAVGNPRRSLAVAAVAAASMVAATTFTTAAWVDDEWAAGSVGVGSPGDCTTNTLFSSEASARQLSGTVLGANLNSIAGVEGLAVTNDGITAAPNPVTATAVTGLPDAFISKLPVTALGGNPLTAALALGVPVGSLGTYTQWAQATESGHARAAAGLVTDESGAVQVGSGAAGPAAGPQAARLSLGSILPESLAGVTLDVGAVASSSTVEGCRMVNGWPTPAPAATRDYGVAGLDLGADVSAVASVYMPFDSTLAELNSLEGALNEAVKAGIAAALEPLGLATVSAGVDYDVEAVRKLLVEPQTEGAVTVNFGTGQVWIDMAKLDTDLNLRGANSAVRIDAGAVRTAMETLRARMLTALQSTLGGVALNGTAEADIHLPGIGLSRATYVISGSVANPAVKISEASGPSLINSLDAVVQGVTDAVSAVISTSAAPVVSSGLAQVSQLLDDAVGDVHQVAAATQNLVSIHVNVQPDQPWTGTRPPDVTARQGEYKVSAIRIGLMDQPGLLRLSLGTSTAGPVKYRST